MYPSKRKANEVCGSTDFGGTKVSPDSDPPPQHGLIHLINSSTNQNHRTTTTSDVRSFNSCSKQEPKKLGQEPEGAKIFGEEPRARAGAKNCSRA
uniref:Uncharacterized protein n=1 Tax=Ditylenchus dipsaci TaxID=166011 RepID=A0A915CX75_9BILA